MDSMSGWKFGFPTYQLWHTFGPLTCVMAPGHLVGRAYAYTARPVVLERLADRFYVRAENVNPYV
jgi:hypothetical protein